MQKYFNNSIMSKFIKNLLKNTYLPICNTVHIGSFIIEGFIYVYETNVIKCTKTGYIGGKYTQPQIYGTSEILDNFRFNINSDGHLIQTTANEEGELYQNYSFSIEDPGDLIETDEVLMERYNFNINDSGNLILEDSFEEYQDQTASYRVLRSYEFGQLYNKYTENYESNSGYYDMETHEYLGKFLRCLRDVKGIDLMPYYNMYSDNYITNFRISDDGFEEYYTNTFKILKVPIKYNQKYTIALDCPSEVWLCPALFNNEIPLVFKQDFEDDIAMTDVLHSYGDYIQNYSSTSFKSPIVFEVQNTSTGNNFSSSLIDCAYFQQYERNLCLLIQVPSSFNSSIVILEGEYSDTYSKKIVNNSEIWQLHDYELNKIFCSNLSLLQFNSRMNFVYSNRLIEYLLWNVINTHDVIYENVELVQELLPYLNADSYTPGVWNNYLRSMLYDFSTSAKGTKNLDLNGFVDKDTEKLLMKQIFNGYSR